MQCLVGFETSLHFCSFNCYRLYCVRIKVECPLGHVNAKTNSGWGGVSVGKFRSQKKFFFCFFFLVVVKSGISFNLLARVFLGNVDTQKDTSKPKS